MHPDMCETRRPAPDDRPSPGRNVDPLVERIRETLSVIGSLAPNALTDPEKLDVAAHLVAQGVRELHAQLDDR